MKISAAAIFIFSTACSYDAKDELASCAITEAGDKAVNVSATIALTGFHDWPAKIHGCGEKKYLIIPEDELVLTMESLGEKTFGKAYPRPYIFDITFRGRFSSETSGAVFIEIDSLKRFEPNVEVDQSKFLNSRRIRDELKPRITVTGA